MPGKTVEVYMDGSRSNAKEVSTYGDGALRNKFVLGFKACSGDWSYACSTDSECTTIDASWECRWIPADTSVFLRIASTNAIAGDRETFYGCSCSGFAENGTGDCDCTHLLYDLYNHHYRDVWVSHVLALARTKVCTGCDGAGRQTPTGPYLKDADCVDACGGQSVAVPAGIDRVFYDNMQDPSGFGASDGWLPPAASASAVRDPDPRRCDDSTPPICHDANGIYDRDEYVRDMRMFLKDVVRRIVAGGMGQSLNVSAEQTLQTDPHWRDLLRDYAASERNPRVLLERAVFDFGAVSLREGPASSGVDIEEALDGARWITGKSANPDDPSPHIPLVIEEPRAVISARHREANMAFALLVTGSTADTANGGRSQWTSAAEIQGTQWFGWGQAQRDWYTSTAMGVPLLGRPARDWVCARGCADSCADGGILPLTGLDNCGVYTRGFPHGAVFFNAKVMEKCDDAVIAAGSATCSGSPSSCSVTTGCMGTSYASIDLDETNGLPTSGEGCLLRGDGTRVPLAFSASAVLSLEPLGAAIVYAGACP
jgi:hypothetical protein